MAKHTSPEDSRLHLDLSAILQMSKGPFDVTDRYRRRLSHCELNARQYLTVNDLW